MDAHEAEYLAAIVGMQETYGAVNQPTMSGPAARGGKGPGDGRQAERRWAAASARRPRQISPAGSDCQVLPFRPVVQSSSC